jgi:hypothetical protein
MRQFPQVFNSSTQRDTAMGGGKKIGVNCALINQRRQGEREEKGALLQFIASIRCKSVQVEVGAFS